MLNPVLTNKKVLYRNVMLEVSLDCSNHKMMEFKILRAAKVSTQQVHTSGFQDSFLRGLLDRIPFLGIKP